MWQRWEKQTQAQASMQGSHLVHCPAEIGQQRRRAALLPLRIRTGKESGTAHHRGGEDHSHGIEPRCLRARSGSGNQHRQEATMFEEHVLLVFVGMKNSK